jgi:hypothetical protein
MNSLLRNHFQWTPAKILHGRGSTTDLELKSPVFSGIVSRRALVFIWMIGLTAVELEGASFFRVAAVDQPPKPSLEVNAPISLPPGTEIMKRVLLRAEANSKIPDDQQYRYSKRSVFEELDSEGRLVKSTEKIYHVKAIHGEPFSRLIKVQGKELSDKEISREDQREAEFRRDLSNPGNGKKGRLKENWLSQDLLDRFEFSTLRIENLIRRPCFVISFKPNGLSSTAKSMQDKIVSRLCGTIWVDERDSEIVKLNVGLTEPVSLGWFGSLGSIHQCDLSFERKRLPDGIWVNSRQSMVLSGRRLVSEMRYHAIEESSDFDRLSVGSK